MQQRTYDLGLRVSDLQRDGESLGEENVLLEQRVSEQTAELSLTVRRLQQELAETKQIEHRLSQCESRFRALYDSAMIGIMFCDVSGKITGANGAFLQLLGYSKDDLALGIIEWSRISSSGSRASREINCELRDTLFRGRSSGSLSARMKPRYPPLRRGPLEGSADIIVGLAVDLHSARRRVRPALNQYELTLRPRRAENRFHNAECETNLVPTLGRDSIARGIPILFQGAQISQRISRCFIALGLFS